MKKSIWKSTVREIKQSLGRYFAILAIVALGVAFYAGLTVIKSAMIQTADKYLAEQNFYDYRIMSTMGLQQEEVDFLQEKDGVAAAEGGVSFDIIYGDESGNENVLKTYSITERINRIKVLYGRMPESANECVVDADLFGEDSLGKNIRLSENNDEDDLECFAYREYTIVGIVQSPLYIQFERGNTSIGSGKISGFVYLPYEGYDVDYFTEIYVKFEENFPLYSEEYKAFIEEKDLVWEDIASEVAHMRFQRILDDANEELADSKAEFETEKADAEADLREAEEQLADAELKLADGETQLADAKRELADAKQTLADNEQELIDAEAELAEKEKELIDGEQALQDGIDEWNANDMKMRESKASLQEGRNQLAEQKAMLEAQEAELLAGEAALNETEATLLLQKQQLEATKVELDTQEQQLLALYGEGNIPAEMMAQIQAGREQVVAGLAQIESGLLEITVKKQEIEVGKQTIADGKTAIAAYEQQLNNGAAQISAGDKVLADALNEINENKQKLADGRKALEDAKVEIADGKIKLADAKQELADAEVTLAEKEQELADAQIEYQDGLEEYEDGLAEFNERIAEAEEKIADAEQEIADLEEPDSYLLGRDTNVGYACFENDSAIIEGIAKIFPVFFFLVAALVCITTMNRMVEEQRTQIGVLKALGYSEAVIMSKYMFYSGSSAIVGCIVGYVGGTIAFPKVIWYAYEIMYRIDSILYVFDWKLAIISVVVSVLCSMGATWMSCHVELRQVAAQLMRPKAPKAGKRIFLEYVPFIWKRLGFLKKVSIRNIFRYKKRLFMMVMGISGCTALLVTGFGIKDSISDVVRLQFEEIQVYDIGVTFNEVISEENKEAIEEAVGITEEHYIPVYESAYELVEEQGRKSVSLLVCDKESDIMPFVNLHTNEDEPIAYPGVGEVVLTNKLAETFGLQVGDTITLQNEDMQTITVRIASISRNFISNYAFINSETYEEQLGQAVEYKSMYMNISENADVHMISAKLMNEENVINVSVNQDIMERLGSMLKSLDLIVLVIIICAGGLAFIVLYNLTNINITERIREIATIQVLGFNKKETASYVFSENMVLAAMGIAVGIVLGHYLHIFVMNEVQIDLITFDIHVRSISYLYSVLLTFGFAWTINKLMGGKLDRISMTESLKSVD